MTFLRDVYVNASERGQCMLLYIKCAKHWRSQALKSGWAQGVWGTTGGLGDGSPPAGSRGGAPVEVWDEAPEARYIQAVCSCQTLFYAGLLPSPSSISPPLPLKTSDLRESHDPTRPEQGGHVPTRGYATGAKKVTPFWYPSFLPLVDALYLQFLFTYISFSLNA